METQIFQLQVNWIDFLTIFTLYHIMTYFQFQTWCMSRPSSWYKFNQLFILCLNVNEHIHVLWIVLSAFINSTLSYRIFQRKQLQLRKMTVTRGVRSRYIVKLSIQNASILKNIGANEPVAKNRITLQSARCGGPVSNCHTWILINWIVECCLEVYLLDN